MLKVINAWMDFEFKPDGFNIGWNCREVGGQLELYAHMNVMPRFQYEPLAVAGIRSLLKSDKNIWQPAFAPDVAQVRSQ